MYLKSNLHILLKADETILDFIEEYALDGLWFWDAEDINHCWINTKFRSVLGFKNNPNDITLVEQFSQFFQQETFFNSVDSKTKKDISHQFSFIHQNGDKLVMDCRIQNVFDTNERFLGILGANTLAYEFSFHNNEVILKTDFFNQLIRNKEFLKESSQIARVGGWEINLDTNALYWNKVTYEIHELPESFQPYLADGINFYKKGINRDTITKAVEECIHLGKAFDVELQITTAKGNEIWVRAIGKADFETPNKKRIYGVFQDIDHLKKIAIENNRITNLLTKLATQVPGTLFQFRLFDTGESYFPYSSRNYINSDQYQEMTPQQRSAYYFQHIHQEDLPMIMQKIQQSAKELSTLSFHYRYLVEAGKIRWISLIANPERLENSVLWHGYSIDITEKKNVEAELKHTQDLLQETNRIAKIGAWERNLSTGEGYWSDFTKEIYGINEDYQPTFNEIVHFFKEGESRNTLIEAWKKCLEKQIPFDLELEIISATGQDLWVRSIGSTDYSDPNNKRILGSIQNITEFKKIEIAKEEANLLLTKLSKQLPGSLYQFELYNNGGSAIIYHSNDFFKIDGFDKMSPTEKADAFWKIIHPDDFSKMMEVTMKAVKSLVQFEYDYRVCLPNGKHKWIHSIAKPEKIKNGVLFHGYLFDITQNKEIEQELKRTKEFLQETNQVARVGGWEMDLNSHKAIRSDVIKEILELPDDYDKDQLMLTDFIKEGESSALSAKVSEECATLGKPFDIQIEVITAKGNSIWIRAIGKADFSNPKKKRMLGIFQDITQYKKSELEREKSGYLLKMLSEQIPGVLIQHDISPKGKLSINYFSQNFASLMGGGYADESQLLDPTFTLTRIHPNDLIHLAPIASKVFEKTDNKLFYFRIITPTNETRWIRSETSNQYNNGNIEWYSYITDVTGEKEVELELKRTQKLLDESSKVARLGGWSFDMKTYFVHWSDVIKEIIGVPLDFNPSVELGISFYKEGYSRDLIEMALKNCMAEGTPFDVEAQIVSTTGRDIWVRVAGKVEMEDDKINRVYGILQDIDHLKIAEAHKEKLQKMELMLAKEKELNAIKSRYLALTSHEFRTPLATILGSTELIEMNTDFIENKSISEKILKHSELIKLQIDRLSYMIKDVLSLEKTGDYTPVLNIQAFSIRTFLSDLVQDYQSNHSLKLFLPNENKDIESDKILLDHIINNLINNAFKYSRLADQKPELHLTYHEQSIQIAVKDFGIGIPQKEQGHIFETFFRASNSIRTEGTGFGLSVAKELAERLGIEIQFNSKEGEGSTFTLSIPI